MKQSGFAKAVAAQVANARAVHTQMCLDAAMIAANEVFNMGPTRCDDFACAFIEALNEIAHMTVQDAKTDKELWYTKDKVDKRLKKICGDKFQPWEKRYS